jgi:hypothetical protein
METIFDRNPTNSASERGELSRARRTAGAGHGLPLRMVMHVPIGYRNDSMITLRRYGIPD